MIRYQQYISTQQRNKKKKSFYKRMADDVAKRRLMDQALEKIRDKNQAELVS